MNIEHISVSRAQTFQECPCKYKFRYHLKIVPDGPEKPWFAYGKTIHKIAETYVERADPEAFPDIAMDVIRGKIEIEPGKKAPPLEGDYKKKIWEHLKNLKTFINSVGLDVQSKTEYGFKYDLDHPYKRMTVGFIDRIVKKGDRYFILDYKTTKPGPFRKNRSTILKDLQLRMYAKVVQKEFGAKAEDITCCLFYVDGGQGELVAATYSQADIDAAEQELLHVYKQIEKMPAEDARGVVGRHCRFCDYVKICPYYSIT